MTVSFQTAFMLRYPRDQDSNVARGGRSIFDPFICKRLIRGILWPIVATLRRDQMAANYL